MSAMPAVISDTAPHERVGAFQNRHDGRMHETTPKSVPAWKLLVMATAWGPIIMLGRMGSIVFCAICSFLMPMAATPSIPRNKDPQYYVWHFINASGERIHRRRALGSELQWLQRPALVRQIYVGADITLHQEFPTESRLRSAAHAAWRKLRRNFPMIAVSLHNDSGAHTPDNPMTPEHRLGFTYKFLEEEDECEAVKGCVSIDQLPEAESGQAPGFWFNKAKDRMVDWNFKGIKSHALKPECLTVARIVLYPVRVEPGAQGNSTNKADPAIRNVKLILNVDHCITDGIGARIILGNFLQFLSEAIGIKDVLQNWGVEVRKPSKQAIRTGLQCAWILDTQPEHAIHSSKKKTEEAALDQWKFLTSDCAATSSGFGLVFGSCSLFGEATFEEQMSLFRSFTAEESSGLLRTVKEVLTPGITINHLGHAAMALTTIQLSAAQLDPDSDPRDSTFYSPGWVNGRRFLRTDPYIPICQAMGKVMLEKAVAYKTMLDLDKQNGTKDRTRTAVIMAAEEVRASYSAFKERGQIMHESSALMGWFGVQRAKEPQKTQRPPPIGKAVPFFLGDGKSEDYIKPFYSTPKRPGHDSVSTLLVVDEIFFSANAEGPEIIIRLSSFRGVLTLSAEWRKDQYPKTFVAAFVERIAELMLLLLRK